MDSHISRFQSMCGKGHIQLLKLFHCSDLSFTFNLRIDFFVMWHDDLNEDLMVIHFKKINRADKMIIKAKSETDVKQMIIYAYLWPCFFISFNKKSVKYKLYLKNIIFDSFYKSTNKSYYTLIHHSKVNFLSHYIILSNNTAYHIVK